jgi:hypothetical protein
VKVFGIIALVLALLFITVHLLGGGLGGHMSSSSGTDPTVRLS